MVNFLLKSSCNALAVIISLISIESFAAIVEYTYDRTIPASQLKNITEITLKDALVTVTGSEADDGINLSNATMNFYYDAADSNTRLYFNNGIAGSAANMYGADYNVFLSEEFENSLSLGSQVIFMSAPLTYGKSEGHMIWEDPIEYGITVEEWPDDIIIELRSVGLSAESSQQSIPELSTSPSWQPFEGGLMKETTLTVNLGNGETVVFSDWSKSSSYTFQLSNGLFAQYSYFVKQNEYGQWEEHIGLTIVPEPSTATLSLLTLAGLLARRRRKMA